MAAVFTMPSGMLMRRCCQPDAANLATKGSKQNALERRVHGEKVTCRAVVIAALCVPPAVVLTGLRVQQ
jgi:hypothetical protein